MAISVTFHKKSVLFWVLVGLVAILLTWFVQSLFKKPVFTLDKTASKSLAINVILNEDGEVSVNNQPVASPIFPSAQSDHFRLKILDEIPNQFENLTVTVKLPKKIESEKINPQGLLIHSFNNTVAKTMPNDQTLVFATTQVASNAVFTITFDLPKGYLKLPVITRVKNTASTLPFFIWLGAGLMLPLLTLSFIITQAYKHSTFLMTLSKAPMLNRLPDKTAPGVVGALHHGRISPREITATLLDLAISRRLTIFAKKEGDFTFAKTPQKPQRHFEEVLLSKLFYEKQIFSHRSDVLYRVGHRIFSEKMAHVYSEIYNQLEQENYFTEPPGKVIARWRALGVGLFFAGIVGFFTGIVFFPEPKYQLFLWLGVILGGILIENFGYLMNNFSKKGISALTAWAGFKKYLSLNEPASYQEAIDGRLERYFPYAVIFGVEKNWLARFSHHPFARPTWFDGDDPVLSMESFSQSILPVTDFVADLLSGSRTPII